MDKVAEVLAGLREEKEKLLVELSRVDRAIGAIEDAMDLKPAPAAMPSPRVPAPVEPSGPYSGLGFYDAAAAYLEQAGEPKTSREIADALVAGGYWTHSANFRSSARTMLRRRQSANPFGIRESEDGDHWFYRDDDPSATP